jgi:hypothetical protein
MRWRSMLVSLAGLSACGPATPYTTGICKDGSEITSDAVRAEAYCAKHGGMHHRIDVADAPATQGPAEKAQ